MFFLYFNIYFMHTYYLAYISGFFKTSLFLYRDCKSILLLIDMNGYMHRLWFRQFRINNLQQFKYYLNTINITLMVYLQCITIFFFLFYRKMYYITKNSPHYFVFSCFDFYDITIFFLSYIYLIKI